MNKGLRGEYDRQYARVQDAILRMGGMVDRAIEEAIVSLQNRDQVRWLKSLSKRMPK